MGVVVGGTIEDLAQQEVLINFSFKPMGTKFTLDKIFAERNSSEHLRPIMEKEANKMVNKKYLYIDENQNKFVFSKDGAGNYSWEPANKKDILIHKLVNLFY